MNTTKSGPSTFALVVILSLVIARAGATQEQTRQIFIGWENPEATAQQRYQQCRQLVRKLETIAGVELVLSVTPNDRSLQVLAEPATAAPILKFAEPALISADGSGLGVSCIIDDVPSSWPVVIDAIQTTVKSEIPSAWITGFPLIRIETRTRLLGIALIFVITITATTALVFAWCGMWWGSLGSVALLCVTPAFAHSDWRLWLLAMPMLLLVLLPLWLRAACRPADSKLSVERVKSQDGVAGQITTPILLGLMMAALGSFGVARMGWAPGPLRALLPSHHVVSSLRELDRRFTTRNATVLCPAGEQLNWTDYDAGIALDEELQSCAEIHSVKGPHNLVELTGAAGMRAFMPAHAVLGAVRLISPQIVLRYLPVKDSTRKMRFDVYFVNDIRQQPLLDLVPVIRESVARHFDISAESVEIVSPMITEARLLHPGTAWAKSAVTWVLWLSLGAFVWLGSRRGVTGPAAWHWMFALTPLVIFVIVLALWDGRLTYPRVLVAWYVATVAACLAFRRLANVGGGHPETTIFVVVACASMMGAGGYGRWSGRFDMVESSALVLAGLALAAARFVPWRPSRKVDDRPLVERGGDVS